MEQRSVGLALLGVAAVLALLGLLLWAGLLGWFGKLPGDIRIERDGFRLYAPLASMFLLSLAATLLWALLRRLF